MTTQSRRKKSTSLGSSGSGSLSAPGKVVPDEKLDEMKNRVVRNGELHLYIMQEPMIILTRFRGSGSRDDTPGNVLTHDSVSIGIDDENWIKAEKGGVEGEMDVGGIRVKLVTDSRAPENWTDPGDGEPGRYSVRFHCVIKLGKGEKEWTVGELVRILTSCDDPEYNAVYANCGRYANASARAVLEWAPPSAAAGSCGGPRSSAGSKRGA